MLAEAFFAKLESASRLLNANQVSFRGCEFRLRIRDIGHSHQFIDVFGRYREYPLSQRSLHLVKAGAHHDGDALAAEPAGRAAAHPGPGQAHRPRVHDVHPRQLHVSTRSAVTIEKGFNAGAKLIEGVICRNGE